MYRPMGTVITKIPHFKINKKPAIFTFFYIEKRCPLLSCDNIGDYTVTEIKGML